MRHHILLGTALRLILSSVASAATHPNESFSDLWDYSTGARVTASSPSDWMPVNAAIGLPVLKPGIGENDVFFRDGMPSNYVFFLEWTTPTAVTVNHFSLFGWDDRSGGAPGRRGIAGFRLYGFENGNYVQLFSGNPTIPYPDQTATQGSELFDQDITAFTSTKWRAEFDRVSSYSFYGPRVLEIDGSYIAPPAPPSGVPLPPALFAAIPGAALITFICRRADR